MGSFFWITVAILVLCAAVGVIAAFWDRKRARKIERDLQTPLEETEERTSMATCEVCGNDYDKSFEVTTFGVRHVFDSFECAIHQLAPVCEHCQCKVIGHGHEVDGRFYCCAHCANEAEGSEVVADRA